MDNISLPQVPSIFREVESKVNALAIEHFDGYVLPLLEVHGADAAEINKATFHYITAWKHATKHFREELELEQS
jgi:predicted butyrate kinase (DUF1464 family)